MPFTLSYLTTVWHELVDNWVTWAMRGLNAASLPVTTPGKAFAKALGSDWAWIGVGLVASLTPAGAVAAALAKTLMDQTREYIAMVEATNFAKIKAVIATRLGRLSETWKKPAVKYPKIRTVLATLTPAASQNSETDDARMRQLLMQELTGETVDAAISQKIRDAVLDRWAHFLVSLERQRNIVRAIRRKEGFVHFIGRTLDGIGYWDPDDESPGVLTSRAGRDAMEKAERNERALRR